MLSTNIPSTAGGRNRGCGGQETAGKISSGKRENAGLGIFHKYAFIIILRVLLRTTVYEPISSTAPPSPIYRNTSKKKAMKVNRNIPSRVTALLTY
jgi:hypothetical protein